MQEKDIAFIGVFSGLCAVIAVLIRILAIHRCVTEMRIDDNNS